MALYCGPSVCHLFVFMKKATQWIQSTNYDWCGRLIREFLLFSIQWVKSDEISRKTLMGNTFSARSIADFEISRRRDTEKDNIYSIDQQFPKGPKVIALYEYCGLGLSDLIVSQGELLTVLDNR
ncbi:hypothetical protein AB6A40_003160 [Gnathostoma spinigerum]|uniref:Uncharacterized protein n=1 Tax=Gnathostoma spinigerum TaxID=75299 RepID=A0ABD6EGD6_9BILA